jgi:hypothetical protein
LPSSRGNKREGVKMHSIFKKIFWRTSKPLSIKLCTHYPGVKEFKLDQIKGQALFKGETLKKCKNGLGSFNHLLQSHWAYFNHTWHKSSLDGEG